MGGHEEAVCFEALEEHRVIEQKSLPDLKAADPAGEAFEARAQVLKELMERNIQREEKNIFAKARNAMNPTQLNELGHQLSLRRAELFSEKMEPEASHRIPDPTREVNALRAMVEKANSAVDLLSRDPAKAIGRGVEEVVRVGARLASEISAGARRGLSERNDTRRQ